jgi:3-oxoacyl-[acyl-carrier protein] reductase
MNIDLSGKTAIVCGSTQGIGKAAAVELAGLGTSVVLIARNEDSLKSVADELSTINGQQHTYIAADFADPDQLVHKIESYLKSSLVPVHILVNNTGGPPGGPIFDAAPAAFLAAFEQHLICNQILVQALVSRMKLEGYGRIINVISTSVKAPIPNLGVSNTVRAAVSAWAKTLAGELGPFGITVNNVLPGYTETGRLASLIKANAEKRKIPASAVADEMAKSIPAGRFGAPAEVAAAIAFLASPAASYINGINLPVDGGRTPTL